MAQDQQSLRIHEGLPCGNVSTGDHCANVRQDRQSTTLAARFWAKVDRKSDSECWPWLGSSRKGGYGSLMVSGVRVSAHRFSYELTKGRIPAGQVVRHSCDNPPCCNPAHLKRGTQSANINDAIRKGRRQRQPIPRKWANSETPSVRGQALQKYVDGGYQQYARRA